ncbi:10028_t:CDS:1, partial [Acaulospora morrowiae]
MLITPNWFVLIKPSLRKFNSKKFSEQISRCTVWDRVPIINKTPFYTCYQFQKQNIHESRIKHFSTASHSELQTGNSTCENTSIENAMGTIKNNPVKSTRLNNPHAGVVKPSKKSKVKKVPITVEKVESHSKGKGAPTTVEKEESHSQVANQKLAKLKDAKVTFKRAYFGFKSVIEADDEKLVWSAYNDWKESRKIIYSRLIDYYVDLGLLDKAFSVLNDFMPNKLMPDKSSISDLFQESISLGLIPGYVTCKNVMYKSSDLQETMKLYKIFKRGGVTFKRNVYDMMIQKTRRERNPQLLDTFYRDMVQLCSEELDQV